MRTFFIRNALQVLLAAVFVVLSIAYVTLTNNHSNELAAQQQKVAVLDERMQAKLSVAKSDQRAVIDGALGTSQDRIAADTTLIRDFVTTVVTWKSGEEYTEARESVARTYKLGEASQFMKVYFPAPIFNTDSSGTRFYVVDTEKLNSSLNQLDVRALGVMGTEYTYMVIADVSANSAKGGASASKPSVFYLTLDGEGQMRNVTAYASTSASLTSK